MIPGTAGNRHQRNTVPNQLHLSGHTYSSGRAYIERSGRRHHPSYRSGARARLLRTRVELSGFEKPEPRAMCTRQGRTAGSCGRVECSGSYFPGLPRCIRQPCVICCVTADNKQPRISILPVQKMLADNACSQKWSGGGGWMAAVTGLTCACLCGQHTHKHNPWKLDVRGQDVVGQMPRQEESLFIGGAGVRSPTGD